MKKTIIIMIIAFLGINLFADSPIPVPEKEKIENNIIKVNHNKKDARLAMVMSSILPGAGQFYTNKKSITGYIFPVLEAGFWLLKYSLEKKGDDKTTEFKKYADKHYSRKQWEMVKNQILSISGDHDPDSSHDIYTNEYFSLDFQKTQHYYEDIGKYHKYFFGWNDWYEDFVDVNEIVNGELTVDAIKWHWVNHPSEEFNCEIIDGAFEVGTTSNVVTGFPSQFQRHYVSIRRKANSYYRKSNNVNFLIALNHVVSAFDAVRVTKKYNRNYISMLDRLKFNVETIVVNNYFTPMLTLSKGF